MRRRQLLVATGTALSTGLAGCLGGGTGSNDQAETPESTATPTETPTPERVGDRRVVTVSGTGEVRGDPDRVLLEFEIQARADTAGAVRDDLAGRADAVRSALLDSGLSEDDVTTTRFSIHEDIDHRRLREADVDPDSPEARERFRFYRGTHSMEVELDDVDAVGSTIDTAADAIAEEVDGEIVEATVVDASRGRVAPVERSGGVALQATPTPAPDGGGGSTAVEPGDVTVSVDVDVRYAMEYTGGRNV